MKITNIEIVNGLFTAKIEDATAFEIAALTTTLSEVKTVTDKEEAAPVVVAKTKRPYKTGKNKVCQYPPCGRGYRGSKNSKYHSISCSTKHAYARKLMNPGKARKTAANEVASEEKTALQKVLGL